MVGVCLFFNIRLNEGVFWIFLVDKENGGRRVRVKEPQYQTGMVHSWKEFHMCEIIEKHLEVNNEMWK